MSEPLKKLHAVIGVGYKDNLTLYVKRSEKMENYPGVWSLLSIRFDPEELDDPGDLVTVQQLMEKMSRERLNSTPIAVKQHLTSADSAKNPINRHVFLHLYEVELLEEPVLNPDFYADSAWLTPEEYEECSKDAQCGLCLRMWSDYAWLHGIVDRPFAPQVES